MLDVKMVRANPDQVRARRCGGGAKPRRRSTSSSRSKRSGAASPPRSSRCARSARKRARRSAPARRPARTRVGEMAATRELGERIKAREAELAVCEARLHELLLALPNIPLPDVPEGGEDDSVVLREVGERPSLRLPARDHVDLGVALDVIDIERAAKVSGSRFAYLKGDLVLLELALVRYGLRRRHGAAAFARCCRPCWCAKRPCTAPASSPPTSSRSTARPTASCLVGTSEVPLAGLHMDEFLEAERAAAALRRLLDLLSARGRRRRQGHARHPARAPVRQARDVQLLPARAAERRARAHPLDRGRDAAGSRASPTAWSTSPPATWARRPPRSTTARPGCPASSATARSRAARTVPTTRRAA